jgi:hypothetical protein
MKSATVRKLKTKKSPAPEQSVLTRTVPAALVGHCDLNKLRYDYPLILSSDSKNQKFIFTLSGVIDQILLEIAPPGGSGEQLRSHILHLEQEIRTLAQLGTSGSLIELWDLAAAKLMGEADDSGPLETSIDTARNALTVDGEVVDCDGDMPSRVMRLACSTVRESRAGEFRLRVNRLIVRLTDILHADYHKSAKARTSESLKQSVGTGYEQVFDFDEMSRILSFGAARDLLSKSRRQRIEKTLKALESQKFVALTPTADSGIYEYEFDTCAAAITAFQQRLPEVVALIKAVNIADLEITNIYREVKHDSYFDHFDEASISTRDLAVFPPYLVCLSGDHRSDTGISEILAILSSSVPIKILFQSDSILQSPDDPDGPFSTGFQDAGLASMAIGINSAYVLQSGSAGLYQLRDQVIGGLNFDGPALFSVFSGSSAMANVPPYLMSAAAAESRAFPTFIFDPAAGPDWAARFNIDNNPQADQPWPIHHQEYQDQDLQRKSEDAAFTMADFAACDEQYASFFDNLPENKDHDDLISLADFLDTENIESTSSIPYVSIVDEHNVLHRMLVTDRLVQASRRCAGAWRSLQELGGIGNSHAENLVRREREIWQQESHRAPEAKPSAPEKSEISVEEPSVSTAEPPVAAAEPEPAEPEIADEQSSDDPYIETPRCTTCNECTQINNRMFAYNDNMQAYIADPDAGTFKEIVEAAENCQVCIIHPGIPRNQNEADLPDLLARAEAFA